MGCIGLNQEAPVALQVNISVRWGIFPLSPYETRSRCISMHEDS